MKKTLDFIAGIVLLAVLAGCGGCRTEVPENKSWARWPTVSWNISTPEAQGISSSRLAKADEHIRENYPYVYSLLVIRHGYLVYEKYYDGSDENTAHPIYSVTKSMMSALTGIALREKLIKSLDQKVSDIMPEYFTEIDDVRKKDITIRNVLTMSGGLTNIDDNYYAYYSSPDYFSEALKKPLRTEPGTEFEYNTGLAQFLSNIITKVSGVDTMEYAEKKLFSKIGIKPEGWDRDSKGICCGGSGLRMTPREMAKFGYLYLNGGQWDGEQVVPKAWVEESTEKKISAPSLHCDYGYLFWLVTLSDSASQKSYSVYRAIGSGYQEVSVVPQLDLITVIASNAAGSSKDGDSTLSIFPDYVLPAVS